MKAGGSDALTRPTVYRDDAGVATLLYGVVPASEYDGLLPTIPGVTPVWGVNDEVVYTPGETWETAKKAAEAAQEFSCDEDFDPEDMTIEIVQRVCLGRNTKKITVEFKGLK